MNGRVTEERDDLKDKIVLQKERDDLKDKIGVYECEVRIHYLISIIIRHPIL